MTKVPLKLEFECNTNTNKTRYYSFHRDYSHTIEWCQKLKNEIKYHIIIPFNYGNRPAPKDCTIIVGIDQNQEIDQLPDQKL